MITTFNLVKEGLLPKFEELAQESYEEYLRGECTELTDEDYERELPP